MAVRLGVDVGGTFTDIVCFDEDTGALTLLKVPSTPQEPDRAVVHATQRIFRFVVVEFRDCANGSPTRGGVAILAWYGEGTVRTSSSLPLSGGRRSPS